MGLINIIALLAILGSGVKTCPPAEEIFPYCTCNKDPGGNVMSCYEIFNSDELDIPIKAVSRRKIKLASLIIYNSSLLFISNNIFKGAHIEQLHFIQTDLMSLSNTDVAFEGLENTLTELTSSGAKYVAQWNWKHLHNHKHLKSITVNYTTVQSINERFPHLPQLTRLEFYETKISYIVDNAFSDLPKLYSFNVRENHISKLKRNMLPDPAEELVFINLSFNEISHLPEDFFTNMPQLGYVFLSFNGMQTLNEMPFSVAFKVVRMLLLSGNPIRCDCRLRWIIDSRFPTHFLGNCSSPKILAGKPIKDLDYRSLWC